MYFSFSPLLSKHSNKGHLCLKEASQGHVNSINAEKEQLEARSSNWQIILFFFFVWLGSAAWHDRHPDTYLPPFPCENLRFVQYKGKGPLHSCSISQLAMHSTCARLLILQASKLRNLILTVKTSNGDLILSLKEWLKKSTQPVFVQPVKSWTTEESFVF